tara:strand:+ start:80083 stop:80367 length:285 start_codon:yes stop_codon:yes gene_type:complete
MGGEGSMASAILSLKGNRSLLKKRKFRDLKDLLYEKSGSTELEFKKVSPSELAKIKDRIRKEAKSTARREILLYLLSFILTGITIYLIYRFFSS